jgi:hypothetical protein
LIDLFSKSHTTAKASISKNTITGFQLIRKMPDLEFEFEQKKIAKSVKSTIIYSSKNFTGK